MFNKVVPCPKSVTNWVRNTVPSLHQPNVLPTGKKKAAKKKLKNPPWPLEEALDDFEWQPSGNEWPKYFSFGFGFYLLLLASTSQIYRNRNRYRCRLWLEIQIQRTAWEIPDTSAVRLGYYQIAKLQSETSANGKWKNCVGCQCS